MARNDILAKIEGLWVFELKGRALPPSGPFVFHDPTAHSTFIPTPMAEYARNRFSLYDLINHHGPRSGANCLYRRPPGSVDILLLCATANIAIGDELVSDHIV
jgi:hypothetical protein